MNIFKCIAKYLNNTVNRMMDKLDAEEAARRERGS